MTLEIHEDTEGNLSVWRDPYEWVDPFSEAEEWALRWASVKSRRDEDVYRLREAHEREVRVLRAQNEALVRHFTETNNTMRPLIVSTEGLDLTGLKVVKEGQ